MQIVVQSGASRQEYQKKERHTTTKTTNSSVKKRQPDVQYSQEDYFLISNRQESKVVTSYIQHTKKRINEQCDSIRCAKKKDDGAQHEPKQ